MDEFGPRLPLALAIAIGVALLALLLGAGINASAVVAVVVHATVPGAWYVIAGAIAGIAAAVITAPRATAATDAKETTR